jgi:hypothetical protein
MSPNPNPAVNTILQDAEHQSFLPLAMVGTRVRFAG